jgi:hypothetical protein
MVPYHYGVVPIRSGVMPDDWDKEMERLDERTAKRRAKAKEQDEEMQRAIREAEQRRDHDKPSE